MFSIDRKMCHSRTSIFIFAVVLSGSAVANPLNSPEGRQAATIADVFGETPEPIAPRDANSSSRRCVVGGGAAPMCEGKGRGLPNLPDVVWARPEGPLGFTRAAPATRLSPEQGISRFKQFVRTHAPVFALAHDNDFVDVKSRLIKHFGSKDVGELEHTVLKLHQTHRGLRIIDGEVNVEFVSGALRGISGTVLPRSRINAELGKLLSQRRISYAHAEGVVDVACPASLTPEPEPTPIEAMDGITEPWIDLTGPSLVYRIFCNRVLYHVDALSGKIIASGSLSSAWKPWYKHIRTGRDGNLTSESTTGDEWFPRVPGGWIEQIDTIVKKRVMFDRYYFGNNACVWQMSFLYDGDSSAPYPTLRPNNGSPRGQGDYCTNSQLAFTSTSQTLLKEQLAYDRIWLGARTVDTKYYAMFWKAIPPDDYDSLRVITWRSDPYKCGTNAWGDPVPGIYDPWYEDIELCIALFSYNGYYVPLHEFGHYIADSYGFVRDDPHEPCSQKATKEGIADAIAVLLEHFRYTGGGETMSFSDRADLYSNGPGLGKGMGATDVDQNCIDPYVVGAAITEVMWQLINNMECAGGCRALGPTIFPEWARRYFTQTLTFLNNDQDVETFLRDIYWRFYWFNYYPGQISGLQWYYIRQIFLARGVDNI